MSNSTTKRANTKKSQINELNEQVKITQNSSGSNLSFIILFIIGFILTILYAIWTSLETYSSQMRDDME
jgi:hypothetical protein